MGPNILVTGATGYIGGSVLAGLLSSGNAQIEKNRLFVAVRSPKYEKIFSDLGVKTVQFDLTDESSVAKGILDNEIDFIIHTASALDPIQAKTLITALGKRRNVTNKEVFFIHTSGTTAWGPAFGSPYGPVKDTEPLFEKAKAIPEPFPVRQTDITVIEEAEKAGVTSFIVSPPIIYGRGDGEWNKMSAMIPAIINAAITRKVVEKFTPNARIMGAHISDLTDYYIRLFEKILEGGDLPSGKRGYYFPIAHQFSWWSVLDRIAKALEARDLVNDSKLREWPSYEVAQESLAIPAAAIPKLYASSYEIIGENKEKIGWVPKWDEERFLKEMDDEVKNVLELGLDKVGLLAAVSQKLNK